MDERDGKLLVKVARNAIASYLRDGKVISPLGDGSDELKEKRGVFVTLRTYPENRLRGCIGLIEPRTELLDSVVSAGISSATRDPRFHPLSARELMHITIEITVLTAPERMAAENPYEYLKLIELGRHGLIIENGLNRGLLLPQVPVEQGWSVEEFLEGVCLKAGLSPGVWMEPESKLFSFEGLIFSEVRPGGEVVRTG